MIRMLPDRVPGDTSAAEVTMFEIIRGSTDLEGSVCLHSLGIARHRRKDYAEGDLIAICPSGVFCLEVKGGHVDRQGGLWTIGWPGGKTYTSLEGPFVQAEGVRWALLDYLKRHLGENVRNEILLGWGVAFPDIRFERSDPEWDCAVVYDQRDKSHPFSAYLHRLEVYFRQRLSDTNKPQPPRLSPGRISQIANCLRGDFETAPSISGLLIESRRELVRLSRDQFSVLDLALSEANPRILCNGGAGTGKTLIAMEAARRLAASGKKILLLCYNDNLYRFLAADSAAGNENVQISTLHKFLANNIRKAGFGPQLSSARAKGAEREFFESTFADLFETAAAQLLDAGELPQFDAVVIDEAQDLLSAPMMNCLDLVLANGFASGSWLIFMDGEIQSQVYGRMDDAVLSQLKSRSPAVFTLRDNFRNPRGIVSEMCALTGLTEPSCRREIQSNVEYLSYSTDPDQGRKVQALLIQLMKQGVAPRDITILSARTKNEACIVRHPPDIGQIVHYLDSDATVAPANAISASSISAFKGLENEVVILTDLPLAKNASPWAQSMFYVGMTRARSKLYAIVDGAFLDARV